MRRETELNSPSTVAEVVGICVICAGTTVWEQKEKACISEASFTIKSSILWIHPLLKHPIQPAGATAHQVWGLLFFSPSLYVSSTVSTFFLKSMFVLGPFFCVCISCLVLCLIFSLSHLVSLLPSWLTVFSWLLSSFAAVFVLTASRKVHCAARTFFPNLLKILGFPFRPIRLCFQVQHFQVYIWNTPTNICSPIKNAAFCHSEKKPFSVEMLNRKTQFC